MVSFLAQSLSSLTVGVLSELKVLSLNISHLLSAFASSLFNMGFTQLPGMPGGGQGVDPREQLLAQLHDVVAPTAQGWWPLAPGWWVLAFLIILLTSICTLWIVARIKANRYRKHALNALANISGQESLDASEQCKQVIVLLKRTFFTAYPDSRLKIAGTFGKQWIDLIDTTMKKPHADDVLGNTIESLLYQSNKSNAHEEKTKEHIEKLITYAQYWIKHHKPRARLKHVPWMQLSGDSHV